MSGIEIERKFLLKVGTPFKHLATHSYHIIQGYIPCQGASVRIRLRDEEAFLTIKSKSADGGLSRYEFEKSITFDEAQNLLKLCYNSLIDKHRYLIPYKGHDFEIDEFHGDNEGLIIAEVELSSMYEKYSLPPFIAEEVTGQKKYYNSQLILYPYRKWAD